MGGDKGPSIVVTGVVDAVNQDPELTVLLVGDREKIEHELSQLKY
ncbi:MAG: phosphate acyltransferase, partial [Candidatus Firestonebacteria bacterium]|nr:phosphate acyltransferase [Candidatus Firestonebacteria bacterium]